MTSQQLGVPDFDSRRILGTRVGLRPFRKTGYRFEVERVGEKRLIHNYGHGGAGVTLSYGCAMEVADAIGNCDKASVAILGAGVMGLTAARILAARGAFVSVYSESFTPNTTSDVAGAQWSPSYIEIGDSQRAQFNRILQRSFDLFNELDERHGVYSRPNYTDLEGDHSFRDIPSGVLPPRDEFQRLPWSDVRASGYLYQTLLIEPSVFLARTTEDCERMGVRFERRRFESKEEVLALPQACIVNCLGLGAGSLFDDPLMRPVRGQLVLLEPQDLPWLLSHRDGYVFPRSDAILLGGTLEQGVTSLKPDPDATESILRRNREFFHPS
ncbi:MAG: FAD-dependent oxidoreductase [Planctomycetota bacterium]